MKTNIKCEKALIKLGITELNDMQIKSLDANRNHSNIVLLSPTGTGKTLAFLLPLLETLQEDFNEVQVLIITPSRELALQIELVFRNMGTSYKVNSCYGGHSLKTEKNNFISPPAVLVGTPGRLSDHIRSGNFSVNSIHTIILDEFDKSLEFGFQQEMTFILGQLFSIKKRILSSATDLEIIPKFTGIDNPFRLNYLLQKSNSNALIINIVKSFNQDKLLCLFHLLCNLGYGSTLIFCNHREAVERISKHLSQSGIINDYFHGGLEQIERERMLIRFRNGSSNILITTDLASRGLDIPDIKHIIHYQLPPNEDVYIHRNGRTARMNSNGSSFIILSEDEKIPSFIHPGYRSFAVNEGMNIPARPLWQTLYFGGGKKDKINKIDIAGFLFKQGGLKKDDIGNIDVKDHHSYAAIKKELIQDLLQKVKGQKIKNKKVKIEISY